MSEESVNYRITAWAPKPDVFAGVMETFEEVVGGCSKSVPVEAGPSRYVVELGGVVSADNVPQLRSLVVEARRTFRAKGLELFCNLSPLLPCELHEAKLAGAAASPSAALGDAMRFGM